MMDLFRAALPIAVVGLAGCNSTGTSNPDVIAQLSTSGINNGVKIELAACDDSNETFASASVATALVTAGFNVLSNLAQASLKDDVNSTFGTYNLDSAVAAKDKCIKIERGDDLTFLAKISKSSKHPKYITVIPYTLSYTGKTSGDDKAKNRDLAIAIGFAKPDNGFGSVEEPLGRLIKFGEVEAPSKEGTTRKVTFTNTGPEFGTQWMKIDESVPSTLVVQVIETTKPNVLVKALATSFEKNKETLLAKTLANDFFKSEQDKKVAEAAARQASIDALTTYYPLLNDVENKKEVVDGYVERCKSGNAPTDLEFQQASRDYDLATRKAYNQSIAVGIGYTLPSSYTTPSKCSEV